MIEILSINNESLPEKNKFNEELYEKISSAKQCQDPFINILLKIFGIELLFKKGKK